ncbi:MAG: type I-G CRISPR-associated protein Cas8g1/Csx17, partial [Gemmatimonadaceae bacterium]
SGFRGDSLVNPWDFVLMLEGAILFAASVVRRARATSLPQAAAPFAVRGSAAGYGSAAGVDVSARGEQWFPLWNQPTSAAELEAVIAEGRSQIGDRAAGRTLDFGRSIARFGVARGITAFERYGFIERNGEANLAVPLGRWTVRVQPHQDLLDQVADWADRLRRAGAGSNAPASITRAARVCDEAMLACCRDGLSAMRWQDLLMALGAAEAQLPRSPRYAAEKQLRPLPRLGAGWIAAANDDSAEFRLALAFATQCAHIEDGRVIDPIRRHFLPLDPKVPQRFHVGADGLVTGPETACTAPDPATAALALIRRRIVEAGQRSTALLPLTGVPGAEARLDDISLVLAGAIDEARCFALARPLMALDSRSGSIRGLPKSKRDGRSGQLALYGIFRLTHLPAPLSLNPTAPPVEIRLDPSIFARLATGDMAGAFRTAFRRLAATGLRPHVRSAVGTPNLARRLALSLAFPIPNRTAVRLAKRLTRSMLDESVQLTTAVESSFATQETITT